MADPHRRNSAIGALLLLGFAIVFHFAAGTANSPPETETAVRVMAPLYYALWLVLCAVSALRLGLGKGKGFAIGTLIAFGLAVLGGVLMLIMMGHPVQHPMPRLLHSAHAFLMICYAAACVAVARA